MEYESVLLIGGPRDGQWISVTKGVPSIRMVQPIVETLSLPYDEEFKGPLSIVKDVIYTRHPINSSQGLTTAVYVFEGVDPLVALINGYRKP